MKAGKDLKRPQLEVAVLSKNCSVNDKIPFLLILSRKMATLWKFKDEAYLTIGVILLVIGAIFVLASIALALEDIELGLFGLGFSSIFFILPSVFLIRHGLKVRKNQEKLEKIKTYLETNRRIKVSRLAEVIGESELDTVSILDEGMEKDLIQGSYEEDEGESYFVYTEHSYNEESPDYEVGNRSR